MIHTMSYLLTVLFSFGSISLAATPPELQELRESARLVMRKSHCAQCHIPGIGTTQEKALLIYNLNEINWSSSMKDGQLTRIKGVADSTVEEIKEMRGNPAKNNLTAKDREVLKTFVDAEMAYRQKFPEERFRDLEKRKYGEVYKVLGQ
jgi:hypothetical protein